MPAMATNFSCVRFSRDGQRWSKPFIIEEGVQDGAHLVNVKGQLIVFNQRYPQHDVRTRYVIRIPEERDWFTSSEFVPLLKKATN